MTKKYKGKTCAYCASAEAAGADHVFARQFFLPQHRAYLPKVPACGSCNGRKSELELYAVSILPFGGRHSSANENLATMVPKRLARNAPLHRALRNGVSRQWVAGDSGLVVPTTRVPIDAVRLMELFKLIGRGLHYYHWPLLLDANAPVEAMAPRVENEAHLSRLAQSRATEQVSQDLGHGDIHYEGFLIHAGGESQSLWHIQLYGGVTMADANSPGSEASSVWVAIGVPGFAGL